MACVPIPPFVWPAWSDILLFVPTREEALPLRTTKIEIDDGLLAELTDILGIESPAKAVDFAIRRIMDIAY